MIAWAGLEAWRGGGAVVQHQDVLQVIPNTTFIGFTGREESKPYYVKPELLIPVPS